MAKILAVNAAGRKQWIPEHWLDHPVLGQGFKLAPSAKAEKVPKRATRRKSTRRTVKPTQPVPGAETSRSDNAQDDR